MAGANYVLDKGFEASEALSQFHFVKGVATAETVEMADAQGEQVLGVVQEEIDADDATNGRITDVRLLGISRVIAGADIAMWDLITPGADGRAEVAATGDFVCGMALSATSTTGGDGDHIDVVLTGPQGAAVA
jgi:hypothetical protein